MIYQLYPNSNILCEPFSSYYSPLCLDCLDSQYLPELKMEYTGMIYAWKNNLDNDDWIGFTSHRQLQKSQFILDKTNSEKILSNLEFYDILCFLFLKFQVTINKQASINHPKIMFMMENLFNNYFNEQIPQEFYKHNCGCFANYWIMSKNNFNNFMEWSYPKVLKIVELSHQIPYLKLGSHTSNSGYLIERLFIVWYLMTNKKIVSLYSRKQKY